MTLQAVTIRSINPPDDINCILGPTNPVLSDGYGGWSEVNRPRRVSRMTWVGRNAFKLSIELVFDGYRSQSSVDGAVQKLHNWATSQQASQQPRIVRLIGAAVPDEVSNPNWVITGLTWGATERHAVSGFRTRQYVTLALAEYTGDEVLPDNTNITPGSLNYRIVTARHGDTLSKIAARVLGNWKRWTDIAKLNGRRDNKDVRAGEKLKVPLK